MNIVIKNLLGISNANIEVSPVTLFVGGNGAGKSSIAAACRMAITGELERVSLKKQVGEIAYNGAKEFGAIFTAQDGRQYVCGNAFGKPEHVHEDFFDLYNVATGAVDIGSLTKKEVLDIVLKSSGLKLTPEKVRESLSWIDAGIVDSIIPLLSISFEEAEKEAKARARDEKTLWKSVTGEAWGVEKGEDWEAKKYVVEDGALEGINAKLLELDESYNEIRKKINQEDNRIFFEKKRQETLEGLKSKFEKLNILEGSLDFANKKRLDIEFKIKELSKKAEGVTPPAKLSCPHCNSKLMLNDDSLAIWEFNGKEPDKEAGAELCAAYAELGLVEADVSHIAKAVREANAAKATYDELMQSEQELKQEYGLPLLQSKLGSVNELIAAFRKNKQEIESAIIANQVADEKTEKAFAHHQNVCMYLKLAEQLSPTGIQLSVTSKAVEMFNTVFKTYVECPLVQVGIDGSLTLNGRQYYLLSESEKWRVNTLFLLALSEISAIKFAIVDRLDILESSSRLTFIKLFKSLTALGRLANVLVMATLKEVPKLPKDINCYWVESGTVERI